MKQRFFICKHCGNIVTMLEQSGVPVVCCNENMTELVANTVDASHEKHVPVVTVEGKTVNVMVGSVIHPMTDAHHISFLALQTDKGLHIRYLKPTDEPCATFMLDENETIEEVYAYCNLHGLWKA